jgi:hypothetical protein
VTAYDSSTYEDPSEASQGGLGGWPPRQEGNLDAYDQSITVIYFVMLSTYEGPSEASHGGVGGWPPGKKALLTQLRKLKSLDII